MRQLVAIITGSLLLASCAVDDRADQATEELVAAPAGPYYWPAQQAAGPGGTQVASAYPPARQTSTRLGSGAGSYVLYEPTDAIGRTLPGPLPVVAFLHGFDGFIPDLKILANQGLTPDMFYAQWVQHLVGEGYLVIFPYYQSIPDVINGTNTDQIMANAAGAIVDAYTKLDGIHHARASSTQFALVGHSVGGMVASYLAANWGAGMTWGAHAGVPQPLALMAAEPGESYYSMTPVPALPSSLPTTCLSSTSNSDNTHPPILDQHCFPQFPSNMLALVTCGDDDVNVCLQTMDPHQSCTPNPTPVPAHIYDLATAPGQITPGNIDFLVLRSDNAGGLAASQQNLSAGHLQVNDSVLGVSTATTLNYMGWWKLTDGLLDAAFTGQNLQYALGNTAAQTGMGFWQTAPQALQSRASVTNIAVQPISVETADAITWIGDDSTFQYTPISNGAPLMDDAPFGCCPDNAWSSYTYGKPSSDVCSTGTIYYATDDH